MVEAVYLQNYYSILLFNSIYIFHSFVVMFQESFKFVDVVFLIPTTSICIFIELIQIRINGRDYLNGENFVELIGNSIVALNITNQMYEKYFNDPLIEYSIEWIMIFLVLLKGI